VNGEYLCPYIYDTTMAQIAAVRATAAGLQARDGAAVEALSEALVVVGIMMSFAGSSRPASGSEHHLSHFFEIVGIVKDEPYLPHGVDVAFSTVEMARLHERLLASPFPKTLYREDSAVLAEKIGGIYGETVGKGCLALQERVGNYKANRLSVYLEKEAELRAILADMPSAEEITEMLAAVGLEKSEYDALYGREKIDTAIRYAKDLKDRYTVLWMFYDLFGGQDE
jgi:glycerol-1-phosphate dehydrogenase [NAD(P)+]